MPHQQSQIDGLTLVQEEPGPHKYPVHTHDGFSIIGLTSGSKWFHICGQKVRVDAPAIAISHPGEPHGCGPVDGDWSHRTWYVSAPLMADIAGLDCDQDVRLRGPVLEDAEIAGELCRAHENFWSSSLLEQQSEALSALQSVVRRYLDRRSEPALFPNSNAVHRVDICESLLLADLAGDAIDLAQLAASVGVHINQVIRDFKQIHGLTPGEFLRMKRLEHAKQVLNDGASLTAAAMEAGFSDQSHFSRLFRQAYGMTPSAYRRLGAVGVHHNPL